MVRIAVRNVRYRKGGPNKELRLALWEVWGSKCYWCSKPVEFGFVQIDHIIPKDVSEPRMRELKRTYGLPHDFDIHDPQNLAPICTPCNGAENKSNDTYDAPIVVTRLKTAEKHRAKVIAHVQRFGRSGKVAAHLLEAATADLSDPGLRQEFLDHAPAVVQILAMMDPRLGDYQSFREVEVAVCEDTGRYQRVDVTLDRRGRSAVSLLEEVCETKLADTLQAPVVQLIDEIHNRVTAGFEGAESSDPITAGPPTEDFITLDVDSLDFSRFAGEIEFTFHGTFAGSLSASLVRSSSDGDGTDELQGDAVVSGTFSIVAVWDLTDDPADLSAGEYTIVNWEQDLHVS
ncbi:HNH endonuclease [Streptomyces sp. NPDC014846]|uniref:HNH endonuclease n=1 Tax=Streptomyces sp. NPDC014846 TaxID=3364922 RepID=UPI0036FC677F